MISSAASHPLAHLYNLHIDHLSKAYSIALERTGFDAIIIHSGSLQKRTAVDDQYWPLRPTPHFQHWLPLAEPECAIVLESGAKPRLIWTREINFWESPPQIESPYFLDSFETVHVQAIASDPAKSQLPKGKRVAFVSDFVNVATELGIPTENVNPFKLLKLLDKLRTLKTPYEIECLLEANRRAARGHDAVFEAFRSSDLSELSLHLRYLEATRQDDPETPYKNIVALGANAATLHHIAYEKRSRTIAAQSLLLDAGATFQGYCADITRTWVKDGSCSRAVQSTFAALIAGVEKLQQKACESVKAGGLYEELHDTAHFAIADVLRDTGIVHLSTEEIVDKGISRAFFPHGLGHSLGLQTHDVGCAEIKPKSENPFLRNTSVIEVGQVFTIEPGIYFIKSLLNPIRQGPHGSHIDWNLVDSLSELGGIRIEDDVVVTNQGIRNLTREVLVSN